MRRGSIRSRRSLATDRDRAVKPNHCARQTVVALVFAAGLLAGCAQQPPEPLQGVTLPSQWGEAGATVTADAGAASGAAAANPRWWQSFDDRALDRLIDDALRTNNDLAAAAIRVYRAQLQLGLVDTQRTPSATLEAAANVSQPQGLHPTQSGTLTGTLSYELDLWGKVAAQRDAAAFELHATEEDRLAARLSLIGTLATLYWRLGYLNRQIALGEANLAYAGQTLRIVEARHDAGAAAGLDVAQAEQNRSNQRAAQTQWLEQRAEARHALAILFDRAPEYQADEPPDLSRATLPEVPAGVPAELLGRRPDLRAAEHRLRASLANIEMTRSSFYPSVVLTGALGTSSTALARAIQNPIATLGLSLAMPFIEWNTMQLSIRISRSQYDEAVVGFRRALYQALSEVEDALSRRAQLDAEAQQLELSAAQAQRAEVLAHARFVSGATGIQPWLDMQRSRRDAQGALELNRLNRLTNRMSLYQALGGDDGGLAGAASKRVSQ